MQAAYQSMHELGYAHSVETWYEGRLVGGLYGVAIGRVFFGESMFSTERDASKVALSRLWLSRFAFGPLEWAWRALTYGRRPRFRRAAALAAA